MIARVDASRVALWTPDNEAALRQCGQYFAYGAETEFLRFYEDDQGNRLSLLEDSAVLYACGDTAEMRLFLTMDPTIRYVRTDLKTAQMLAEEWNVPYSSEAVMRAPAVNGVDERIASDMTLREIYDVMTEGFGKESIPLFDSWYVDVHHRIRHGCCRTVGVREGDAAVACAMTVAECDSAALIGAVATRSQARGKGYASACVLSLAAMLQAENKCVLLSPKNEYAHRLYDRIGFTVVGEWGSVKKV